MSDVHHHYYNTGIGIGTVIAVLISWSMNHSILWAVKIKGGKNEKIYI